MPILKKNVLLLKAQDEFNADKSCKYAELLSKFGYTVKQISVLDFEYVILDTFYKKLTSINNYSGIIFTSPRSVIATKKSLKNNKFPSGWKHLSNYVIGDTSNQLINKEFNLDCQGSESGNADNLADIIIKDKDKFNLPFLYPCGSIKRDVLPTKLKEQGIEVDAVTVYNTIKNPRLDEEFKEALVDFTQIPEYVVFFSPSGVKFTFDIFNKIDDKDTKLIAFGPATANEIQSVGWHLTATAEKPTPEHLLQALESISKS